MSDLDIDEHNFMTKFTTSEMITDRADALVDAALCRCAMRLGITTYFNGTQSVQARLDENMRQVGLIERELTRRLIEIPPVPAQVAKYDAVTKGDTIVCLL